MKNEIYKFKPEVEGFPTPGGYAAVRGQTPDKVTFAIVEDPDHLPKRAWVFTMESRDFYNMVEPVPLIREGRA